MRFGSARRSLLSSCCAALVLFAIAVLPGCLSAQTAAPAVAFGSVNVGSSATQTVTFTFTGTTTVSSVSVVTQGAPGLDFQAGTPAASGACAAGTYAASATCTVAVNFSPLHPGGRLGAVLLATSSPSGTLTGYVYGTGVGPLALFQNGTLQTTFSTSLNQGRGLQVDALGNLYLSEQGKSSVDKFSPNGTETVLTSSMNGDNGALDGAGNFYFGSQGGTSAAGIYELVGGVPGTPVQVATGFYPDNGLAVDGSGNLYGVEVSSNNPVGTIFEVLAGGPSLRTNVKRVSGTGSRFIAITSDVAGNVYTADFNASILYELPAGASTFTQLASGSPLASPHGVTLDAAGNIYVSNYSNSTVIRYSAGTYTPTVLTTLSGSVSLTVGPDGNIYTMSSDTTLYGYSRTVGQTLGFSNTFTAGSNPATLTQENDGNAPLIYTVPASGYNPSFSDNAYSLAANSTCPQLTSSSSAATLAAGATCTDVVTFSPTSAAPDNATLTIQDNSNASATAAQTAALTGTGVSPNTTIALTGTASSSMYGQSLTFTATVTGTNPAGSVVFYNNGASLGTVTLSSGATTGTAQLSTTTLAVGAHSITAVFTSTSPAASETSNAVSVTIAQGTQTVTFNPPPNPGYAGGTTTLSASASSGLAVSFSIVSGPATIAGSVVTYTATGTVVIAANQAGNANYQPASQVTQTVTVQPLPTFTVTVLTDPAAPNAANCTDQAISGATPDASCSLRDALAAADAAGFTGTAGMQPTVNFAPALYSGGPATITLSQSTAITMAHNVNLAGPGPSLLSLSGNNVHGILVQGGASMHTTVSGLTLTLANGAAAFYSFSTGGVETFSNDVFLSNSNTSSGGGAIATLASSTAATTINVTGSSFISNQALNGGAIFLESGGLTIASSNFSANLSTNSGGAVYCLSAPLAITTSSFTGNSTSTTSTSTLGGALYASSSTAANSITNSTFSGNSTKGPTTSEGGALYLVSYTVSLTGVTISGNSVLTATTNRYGGGIYKGAGTLNLYNSTVTGNSARSYGGIYGQTNMLDNSLIGGNTASTFYADTSPAPAFTTGSLYSIGTAPTSTIVPLLSALGNYGGPVVGAGAYTATLSTQVPLPGSPLLAAGTNTAVVKNNATLDARGLPRTNTYNGATHVDIGPVEANYSLAFTQEPASTRVNTAFSPVPAVQISESGVAFNASGGKLTVGAASGTPSLVSLAITASPVPLSVTFPQAELNDSLIAGIASGAGTPVTVAADTSTAFNITDAAATLGFGTPPPAQLVTGSGPGMVTVQMLTSTGALDTAGTDTLTLTVTAPSYTTQTYTAAAVNGVATFAPAALTTAGTYTYTASDTSPSPYTTDTVATTEFVGADTVDHFALTGLANPVVEGTPSLVTVTAIDPSGNVDASFTGPVALTSTDLSAGFQPQNYTFVAGDQGIHTFSVTLNSAGTQSVVATNNFGQTGMATTLVPGYLVVISPAGDESKFNTAGTALSPASGYAGGGAASSGLAIDANGNSFSVSTQSNTLTGFSKSGVLLSGSGYTGGGLSSPSQLAIDGLGRLWITNSTGSLSEFSNTGTALSPATGYASAGYATPSGITIDLAGSVWVANSGSNTITEVIGGAAPVAPASTGLTNNTTGSRP